LALDERDIRECLEALKTIDFELAYLAALTGKGLKPLSRWEKPLDDAALELLGRLGLHVRRVRRTVQSGKGVVETVFSPFTNLIDLYGSRFDNTPVSKSPGTQRLEGFLFGYPPCCIESYIRRPYAPNNLAPEDQQILFHWACSQCQVTPLLLPAWRRVHALLMSL